MKDFKELEVWKKSMELADEVYKLSKLFPPSEQYSLTDQLRRSAISVPSNIAEGHDRGTDKDFIRFLFTARGSAAEAETQILLAVRLQYVTEAQTDKAIRLCGDVRRMINSFIRYLNNSQK